MTYIPHIGYVCYTYRLCSAR